MTETEAVTLVAYVAAGCPSMRMADHTPDVWYDAGLADIPLDVAKEAAANLIRIQPYIGLHDLIREADAIQHARLAAIRRAQLERDDPERFAINTRPAHRTDDDSEEAKRAERRRIFAEAFAAASIARQVPKVDTRPHDRALADARAELTAARERSAGEQPTREPAEPEETR